MRRGSLSNNTQNYAYFVCDFERDDSVKMVEQKDIIAYG